jgi:hypothetical protein
MCVRCARLGGAVAIGDEGVIAAEILVPTVLELHGLGLSKREKADLGTIRAKINILCI